MSDNPIIDPLNQFNYFVDTLFFQYLGTEQGSVDLRNYINPAYTDVSNGIEHIYQTILEGFKIDDAVGVQLDIIGNIIGLPRPTNGSIGADGFFGFDSLPNFPFDTGSFIDGRSSGTTLVSDDKYRIFIKIKIIKNIWDGTRVQLKSLLALAVDADSITIETLTPANFQILLEGGTVTQDGINELLSLDLIPTPQGVKLLAVKAVDISVFTIEDDSEFVIEDGRTFIVFDDK